MTLILDSGAFIAFERDDRPMWRRMKDARQSGSPPITHGGVVALDDGLGRRAGVLLARSGLVDAVDAAVAASDLVAAAAECLVAPARLGVVDEAVVSLGAAFEIVHADDDAPITWSKLRAFDERLLDRAPHHGIEVVAAPA